MKHLTFILAGLLTALGVNAEPAHVHGQATLNLAVDGQIVNIALETPLDNVLGFERAPRNEAERQRVRAAVERLKDANSLFVFDPAAQCVLQSVELESAALPPDLLGKPAKTGEAHAKEAHAHADMDVDYVFSCRQINALTGVDVGLFGAFPRMKRLSAQVAGKGAQSAQRLTPQASRIVFKP